MWLVEINGVFDQPRNQEQSLFICGNVQRRVCEAMYGCCTFTCHLHMLCLHLPGKIWKYGFQSDCHLSDVVGINLGESHENMSFLFLLNVGV